MISATTSAIACLFDMVSSSPVCHRDGAHRACRGKEKAAPKDGLSRCGERPERKQKRFFLGHVDRLLSRPYGGTKHPHLFIKHTQDPTPSRGQSENILRH
jgi:hypothetical protein